MRLEPLEERRMLSDVTVSNLNDVVNGNVTSIANLIANQGGDGISLREAILAANAGAAADTIDFDPDLEGGVIQLTNVGHAGEIAITNDLTINGLGAFLLTIRAFGGTAAAGDGARIFNVDDGNAALRTVAINDLTLTGGDVASSLGGGAILNRENLTVRGVTVVGNSAGSASVGYHGGGMVNWGGTLTVRDSLVTGNSTTFGRGGGIYSTFGTLVIERSTIRGNAAGSTGSGGGVYANYTPTTIDSSTIVGNTANVGGGTVQVGVGVLMTIVNSTVSGNTARTNGGGVVALFGDVSLKHSTVTNNRADSDGNGSGTGGGLFVHTVFSNATVDHTIVAGNFRGTGSTRDEISGTASARFSLIGINTGATIVNQGGNQIGAGVFLDPLLGQLAENGGPTMTHALMSGSPAIDAGDAFIVSPPASDQRGAPFVRVYDGNNGGQPQIDIGAYERQTLAGLNLVVDILDDEIDMNYGAGDLSLREALGLANGSVGFDTITFAPALTAPPGAQTILLTMGQLMITDSVDVVGPGAEELRLKAFDPDGEVDGNGWRIVEVNDGVAASMLDVEISGLTLLGGDNGSTRGGGAIFTRENLRVVDSVIANNRSIRVGQTVSGSGGGIANAGGNLEVIRTSILDNRATESGGGIYSLGGSLTVVESTITGNKLSAGGFGYGGGIYNGGGDASITDSEISYNFADRFGGGISNRSADIEIFGSRIVGNSSDYIGGGLAVGGTGGGGGSVAIFSSVIADNHSTAHGGGIMNFSYNFTISRSTITGNTSARGGGINSSQGSLGVYLSSVSGNTATVEGGGIYSYYGTILLDRTTVGDNDAVLAGGGLSNHRSNLTITGSTIHGNSTSVGNGGGLRSFVATTVIEHSTFAQNYSEGNGGGMEIAGGSLTMRHATIARNQTDIAANGGGIAVTSATAFLENSIVAQNDSFHAGPDDIFGAVTMRYSLIGIGTGATITVQGNAIIGAGTPVDPLLGQLFDNGGPTKTMALLPGSLAIDMGDPDFAGPPDEDQRGSPFVRVYDGDGAGGARIDIGAYERQTVVGLNLVVDTLDDATDGKYSPGHLSLREALGLANGSIGADTVTFAPALTSGGPATILLKHGQLEIADEVTVLGPGAALLTIDASGNDPTPAGPALTFATDGDGSRVVAIDDSDYASHIDVELFGLTFTGGDAPYQGGGIFNRENLTISESVVYGNRARFGGGIFNESGQLTVRATAIRNNLSEFSGGGILNNGGGFSISRSEISGNVTRQRGGGIWSNLYPGNTAAITNSTISGNSAPVFGGGIYHYAGPLEIKHTTIAANWIDDELDDGGPRGGGLAVVGGVELDHVIVAGNLWDGTRSDVAGVVAARYTLIGDGSGAAIMNGGGNLIGTALTPIDPLLSPLADHGGPTRTHALTAGSQAIDAGDASLASGSGAPQFDQRGDPFTRVFDGDGTGGAQIDLGAYELIATDAVHALYGDYNRDGRVDGGDYVRWRNTLGTGGLSAYEGADGSGNGSVGVEDYDVWKAHYGQSVPVTPGGGGSFATLEIGSARPDSATLMQISQPAAPSMVNAAELSVALSVAAKLPSVPGVDRMAARSAAVEAATRDDALLAWLAARATRAAASADEFLMAPTEDSDATDAPAAGELDTAYALAADVD